jgi:hypothetical protein
MMVEFDWMEPRRAAPDPQKTLATRHDEIRVRARLFAALGYARARAEQRLRQNLLWECERLGRPRALADVPELVKSAYELAGVKGDSDSKAKRKPARGR